MQEKPIYSQFPLIIEISPPAPLLHILIYLLNKFFLYFFMQVKPINSQFPLIIEIPSHYCTYWFIF
jgi:hypothetical protein